MAAEVTLSNGTTIKTGKGTTVDEVLRWLGGSTGFQPITDQQERVYFVNPVQVVYIRDV